MGRPSYDPVIQTEALFRRASTERIVEASNQGDGWLATAAHAELRMAWERGREAGRCDARLSVTREDAE